MTLARVRCITGLLTVPAVIAYLLCTKIVESTEETKNTVLCFLGTALILNFCAWWMPSLLRRAPR
jgi:hypothetical protein